ncbi:MAG: hypothetical protein ABMB14_41205, partial [Myxococcota bacterium]
VGATQNPMDLDYRALSSAGMWFVGRLQTDGDRARVVEGMASATGNGGGPGWTALSAAVKKLARRWFVLRNVHAEDGTILVNPRHTITWMRGSTSATGSPAWRRPVRLLYRSLEPASSPPLGAPGFHDAMAEGGHQGRGHP